MPPLPFFRLSKQVTRQAWVQVGVVGYMCWWEERQSIAAMISSPPRGLGRQPVLEGCGHHPGGT